MTQKPRIRIKMGRQRINAEGLKLWDPMRIRFPWLARWTYYSDQVMFLMIQQEREDHEIPAVVDNLWPVGLSRAHLAGF